MMHSPGITACFLAIMVLGLATGCRSMTAIAVLCWFARLHRIELTGSHFFWLANPISVGVFTVMAAGEWIGDKLPFIPNRTDLGPLFARLAFGGLIGAAVATGENFAWPGGALIGAISAWAGALLGFHTRRYLTKVKSLPDVWVALTEDLLVIAGSIAAMLLATR
jgi:uncharacterized membrane protein